MVSFSNCTRPIFLILKIMSSTSDYCILPGYAYLQADSSCQVQIFYTLAYLTLMCHRHLDLSAAFPWLADQNTTPCSVCDNCTRNSNTVQANNVTMDIWTILQIVQVLQTRNAHITLQKLADVAYRQVFSSDRKSRIHKLFV